MAEKKLVRMFPPYLNKGSKGEAVDWLEGYLEGKGFIKSYMMNMSQEDRIAKGIENLQLWLGFTGDDVDGNFGPGTREELYRRTGLDVDIISSKGGKTFWWGDKEGSKEDLQEWPEAA